MTFDETKTITMTPEQARTHHIALTVLHGRIVRNLERYEKRIDDLVKTGDTKSIKEAQGLYCSIQPHYQRKGDVEKELARLRDIFGDMNDAKSHN